MGSHDISDTVRAVDAHYKKVPQGVTTTVAKGASNEEKESTFESQSEEEKSSKSAQNATELEDYVCLHIPPLQLLGN